MPIIEIHTLIQPRDLDRAGAGRAVNEAVAQALGCKLEAVWTIWRTIDGPFVRGDSASNDGSSRTFGPIVHVYHHRTPEQVERVVEAIETVLARVMAIAPGDVFVTSQPVAIDDPRA